MTFQCTVEGFTCSFREKRRGGRRITAHHRRSGFTWVEMLIVIGIIVFLLALLLPATRSAREAARRTQCNNNLKQIGLGLQTYADVNKSFPYDALWGMSPNNKFDADDNRRQFTYHYPWSFQILCFLEDTPLYDAVNKRGPIWNQNPQLGTSTSPAVVPVQTPPPYLGYIQSQQIPPYRCPSDATFTGPSDVPGSCMWTNYAGNAGIGLYSAKVKDDVQCEGETTAPSNTKGIFTFNEPTKFAMIKDGTSNTIAVAEVTACSVAAPIESGTLSFNSDLKADLSIAADATQPLAPDWNLGNETSAWTPPTLLASGIGKSRSKLITSPTNSNYVPMVFRSAMVALTESVTGTGPCSVAEIYTAAQGGDCGQPCGDSFVAGFELSGKFGKASIVGIAPLYNALYSPNSNWLGPDSNHPGVALVVFADGHTNSIQNSITFYVWASINSRQGGETLSCDF